jgi:hypothetical protein
MKQITEEGTGTVGFKVIVVMVALIVAVAAVSVILVIGMSNDKDDKDDEDNGSDPVTHYHMSAGSTITYQAVEGSSSTFILEVIGTNVFNYALDVSPISSLLGTSMNYQLFKIDTGELRFAENEGTSTAIINGESVELKSFEVTDSDRVKWTFFTRADLNSEVPLMFECVKGSFKIRAELKSTDLEYAEYAPHDADASHNFVRSNTDVVKGNVRIYTVTETCDMMMIGEDTLKVHLSSVTETNVPSGAETDRYNTVSYTYSKS